VRKENESPTFTWTESYGSEQAEIAKRHEATMKQYLDSITTPVHPEVMVPVEGGYFTDDAGYVNHTPYVRDGKLYCHACGEGCSLYSRINVNQRVATLESADMTDPIILSALQQANERIKEASEDVWKGMEDFWTNRRKRREGLLHDVVGKDPKRILKKRRRNKLARIARRK
jgi:hypothetical protein